MYVEVGQVRSIEERSKPLEVWSELKEGMGVPKSIHVATKRGPMMHVELHTSRMTARPYLSSLDGSI